MTEKLIAAARQALEALEFEADGWEYPPPKTTAAITALREALGLPRVSGDRPQDVKALPVVAWVDDLTKPQPHCVTDLRYRSAADADAGKAYTPVVRQSDAESAIAELRAEVERLRTQVRNLKSDDRKMFGDDTCAT